jgi:hypothetical protein
MTEEEARVETIKLFGEDSFTEFDDYGGIDRPFATTNALSARCKRLATADHARAGVERRQTIDAINLSSTLISVVVDCYSCAFLTNCFRFLLFASLSRWSVFGS